MNAVMRKNKNMPSSELDYSKKFTRKIIGHYSVNEANGTVLDQSSMKFLKETFSTDQELDPKIVMKYDENRFKSYSEEDQLYSPIFPWIEKNQELTFDIFDNKFFHDFLMTGRTLRSILKSPFTNEPTEFKIVKFLNLYYVSIIRNNIENKDEEINSFMGHQFEISLSEENPNKFINANKRYYNVLDGEIGNLKVIYDSNVDCVEKSIHDNEEIPIELCLKKGGIDGVNKYTFARYTMLDMWCKSFIGNIPKVICGFRNNDYVVTDLKVLEVDKLPYMAHQVRCGKYMWRPNVCITTAKRILEHIKFKSNIDERTVYKLIYSNENMKDKFIWEKDKHQEFESVPKWFLDKYQ